MDENRGRFRHGFGPGAGGQPERGPSWGRLRAFNVEHVTCMDRVEKRSKPDLRPACSGDIWRHMGPPTFPRWQKAGSPVRYPESGCPRPLQKVGGPIRSPSAPQVLAGRYSSEVDVVRDALEQLRRHTPTMPTGPRMTEAEFKTQPRFAYSVLWARLLGVLGSFPLILGSERVRIWVIARL